MKATCPCCLGKIQDRESCEQCSGTGLIDVHFASELEGHYHFIVCKRCGKGVGGALHHPNKSAPTLDQYAICPYCRTKEHLAMTDCDGNVVIK